jgi:hypothetical protein
MRPRRLIALLAAAALLAVPPAHAFWGVLGKLGKASATAGKGAGTAAKAGGAAAVGAEAAEGASLASQAAKAGAAGADEAGSAAQLSKASGLGPAVPDEVAAMLRTPGKTLADVPDPGTRAWLSTPPSRARPGDPELMVHDYVKLLEGRPAAGPAQKVPAQPAALPTRHPPSGVPWHALELLARAAVHGHRGAQSELDRLCATPQARQQHPGTCARPAQARKP